MALAVGVALAPVAGPTPLSTADAAPVTISSANFDDDTLGDWQQSGTPTYTYLPEGDGKALQVSDRTAGYDSVSSAVGIFDVDVEYTLSARVRLAAGTAGSAEARFVGHDGDGNEWIGNTTIDASDWTTLTGTFTVTDAGVPSLAKAYVEVAAPASFLLDDVLITRAAAVTPPPATDVVVSSANFDDDTLGDWQQSGTPTYTYLPEGDGKALQVSDRTFSHDSVSSALGIFDVDVDYTLSARVRLAPGTVGSTDARFVGHDGRNGTGYGWIGNTSINADAWTTLTGTFTVTDVGVPASASAFVEVGEIAGTPASFLLDDVLITRAAAVTPPPATDVELLTSDFETDLGPWSARGPVTLARVTSDAHGGSASMSVTGRTADWHGAAVDIAPLFETGGTYTLTAWVKMLSGTAGTTAKVTVAETPEAYSQVTDPKVITTDEWVEITGTYTMAPGVTGGVLYFEASDPAASFLVDDVLIVGPAPGAGGGTWTPTPDPAFVPGGAVGASLTPVGTARGTGDVAALTFDDGPNPGETDDLLDFLAEKDVVATFCVIGQNITAPGGTELLNRIVDEGHTVCNHTTGYADMGSWSHDAIEADLKANLAIIRTALDDPYAQVPYFRAPNGSWGNSPTVAVALGMQPLAVTGTISDWDPLDETTLTANLRTAMQPGRVALVHDGGGDRTASVAATKTVVTERLADGWTFTLPTGGIPSYGVVLESDFETGVQGWVARADASGTPNVAVTSTESHGGNQAAIVTNRVSQGSGIGYDVSGLFQRGVTYEISAWVKFPAGTVPDDIWMSMARTNGASTTYDTVGQFTGITSSGWTQVTATYQMPAAESALLYLETSYPDGSQEDFLLDDVVITSKAPPTVQNLRGIMDTMNVPVGVAIDSREAAGAAAQLLRRHYNQVSAENHMKPENWYDASGNFSPHPEAEAIMAFAQASELDVYGHTLVWHAQTPAWFFESSAGVPLTTSSADKQTLRERMRTHIFAVAEHLSDGYGLFGSDENPLTAWDVVNEVVSDGAGTPGGLRTSEWQRILGEEFIDLAFRYADEAFNDVYAAPGTTRPITLFINDYNTEQPGKQQRVYDLLTRLLARDVPVDGVGHQFHVNLAFPVEMLEATLVKFSDLGIRQAVTEFDVTTGTPANEAKFVEQGYYYKEAFAGFRRQESQLFSVTIWGIQDSRSWRNSMGGPLPFDAELQAKPAYYGIVGDDLPARMRSANVFGADVRATAGATSAAEWDRLRLHRIDENASFQLRWKADRLTAYVEVLDATSSIEFLVGDRTYRYGPAGGDAVGVSSPIEGGYAAVVELPLGAAASEGDTLAFDLRLVGGSSTSAWNTPGALGSLSLVETLSFTAIGASASAPVIDGAIDGLWTGASSVTTMTQVAGTPGASAVIRSVWKDQTLYVLAEVTDSTPDVSASDPWVQDSLEIFLDGGNFKSESYRYDDTQIRISADNVVSFGAGDQAFQEARLTSATRSTSTGYVVEAAISLLEDGGKDTFHGLDFQVNDGSQGSRVSARTWADPTGAGNLTPARWGVAQLVDSLDPAPTPDPDEGEQPDDGEGSDPALDLDLGTVEAGGIVTVTASGFTPGDVVQILLEGSATATASADGPGRPIVLGDLTVAEDGTGTLAARIPATTAAGRYDVVATVDSEELARASLTVTAAADDPDAPDEDDADEDDDLATTGAEILGLALVALLLIGIGTAIVARRRAGTDLTVID